MINIVFVVNSLKESGPSNQLYYLIKNLNIAKFKPYLIVLSYNKKNRVDDFRKLELHINELNLSKIQYLFKGKVILKTIMDEINPEIIHSHGIRPDLVICKLKDYRHNWIMTSRNYPYHDYIMKFGKLLGTFMAIKHINVMKKCSHLVSCSNSIRKKLSEHGITSTTIYNGTSLNRSNSKPTQNVQYSKPVFIVVGNLIERKNNEFIIKAFKSSSYNNTGSLIFLGDGPEKVKLQKLANDNVFFLGHVDNVDHYLSQADIFISASKSEGLPNTVLEALANKLPVILSSIAPHEEIKAIFKDECILFDIEESHEILANIMSEKANIRSSFDFQKTYTLLKESFSAQVMSRNYQNLYQEITESK